LPRNTETTSVAIADIEGTVIVRMPDSANTPIPTDAADPHR